MPFRPKSRSTRAAGADVKRSTHPARLATSATPALSAQAAPAGAKSAAWLLAEGAFGAPQRTPDGLLAVVTVRKSRGVPAPTGLPRAVEGPTESSALDEKGPRVFRIDTVVPPSWPKVQIVESSAPDQQGPAAAVSRKRQIAVHKRPGPVQQLFSAPDRPAAGRDFSAAPGLALTTQVDRLTDLLAEASSVLAAAQKARAWVAALALTHPGFASAWQQLSREADELQLQINQALQ